MPIRFCPRCWKRIAYNKHDIDIIHTCNSGREALDKEPVFCNGNWEDYTGSGERSNPMMQGIVNRLNGTPGGILGEDIEPRNKWGKRISTHRKRQHLEFVNLK